MVVRTWGASAVEWAGLLFSITTPHPTPSSTFPGLLPHIYSRPPGVINLQALIFLSAPCLGLNSFLGGCRHPVLTLDTLRSASRLLGSGPARVQEYRPPTHILEPQVSSEPGCTQGRRKLTQPPSKVLGLVMVTCHNFETHL